MKLGNTIVLLASLLLLSVGSERTLAGEPDTLDFIHINLPEEITSTCDYSHGTGRYSCEVISATLTSSADYASRIVITNLSSPTKEFIEVNDLWYWRDEPKEDHKTSAVVTFRDSRDATNSNGLVLMPGPNRLEFKIYETSAEPLSVEAMTVRVVQIPVY